MSNLASIANSELSWYLPGKVMCLRISGDYAVEDSLQVSAAIIKELDQGPDDLVLLIDATAMSRPYHFDQIRATQTYKDHRRLKHIYVVAGDRLVKLAFMIIFNLSRARLHVYDDIKAVDNLIRRQVNWSA